MIRTSSTGIFDRLVTWSLDRPLSRHRQYLLAIALVTVVGVLRAALVTDLLPWLLFIPVILGVTLVTGRGPGLLATMLAAALAIVSLGDASAPFWMPPQQWLGAGLFLLIMAGLVAMAAALRQGLQRGRSLNRDLVARERTLADKEAFLSSVLAASTDCIKVLNLDGTLAFMSEGGMKTMEVSDFNAVRGCPWPDLLKHNGPGLAAEAIAAACRGETSHFDTDADTFAGTPKHWSVSVSPIFGQSGAVEQILSVSRDHTGLHEARMRQKLLNGELSHRLKNVLALVQSIAYQTLRDASSLQEASVSFAARVASLGQATDILTASDWQKADLTAIVRAGLASVEAMGDRLTIDGPNLVLEPRAALGLTLSLHELSTNAVKYGALSNDSGTVSIRWAISGPVDARHFEFEWKEAGGPVVHPPQRKGFGSRMIERSLKGYFRGTTVLSYPPSGVVSRIDAPAGDAVAAGSV